MLETITSNRICHSPSIELGSSSIDGEAGVLPYPVSYQGPAVAYRGRYNFLYDVASGCAGADVIPAANETYKSKETPQEQPIEHDLFVNMPPKTKYMVKATIVKTIKATPRIVIPDHPHIEI
jgi:hypothetical protein